MVSLKQELLLLVAAILLAGCIGCTLRQPSRAYRFTEIDSQYFLLSPDAAASQGDHQSLRIPRPRKDDNSRAGLAMECSIKGAWFSFDRASGNEPDWIAVVPSASAWARSAGTIDMMDQWQSFERALYSLQQKQCFASLNEYLVAKRRIDESLSPPASDTLFYRYAYGPGGYVDLASGMQLRIERDFFAAQSSDPPRPTKYEGTTITYYSVSGSTESGAALKFLRTEKKPAEFTIPASSSSDENLVTRFAPAPHLRLFLQDLVVFNNAKSPAILIGAITNEDLNAATQAIEGDPGISCSSPLLRRATCEFFAGLVTVSPMLNVNVNGRPTCIPIGSRLWSIFPVMTKPQQEILLRTLRVERSFQGRLVDVQFPRNFADISQLLLFGGDRISWSRAFKTTHKTVAPG